MNSCILVLIAPLSIENAFVDWLLNFRQDIMFSSEHINCYGMSDDALDLSQQVAGYLPKVMYQLQLLTDDAKSLCAQLEQAFPNKAIRFWILPTIEVGYIGDPLQDTCNSQNTTS